MEQNSKIKKNSYTKFVGMLVASFIAMYITMYLNTYAIDHVYFSLTRFYMTCLGISAMAIIMFVAMRTMYQNKKKNIAIVIGSIALFVGALGLVRGASPIVGDVLWTRAMIPHHSIAILTSERAISKTPKLKNWPMILLKLKKRKLKR